MTGAQEEVSLCIHRAPSLPVSSFEHGAQAVWAASPTEPRSVCLSSDRQSGQGYGLQGRPAWTFPLGFSSDVLGTGWGCFLAAAGRPPHVLRGRMYVSHSWPVSRLPLDVGGRVGCSWSPTFGCFWPALGGPTAACPPSCLGKTAEWGVFSPPSPAVLLWALHAAGNRQSESCAVRGGAGACHALKLTLEVGGKGKLFQMLFGIFSLSLAMAQGSDGLWGRRRRVGPSPPDWWPVRGRGLTLGEPCVSGEPQPVQWQPAGLDCRKKSRANGGRTPDRVSVDRPRLATSCSGRDGQQAATECPMVLANLAQEPSGAPPVPAAKPVWWLLEGLEAPLPHDRGFSELCFSLNCPLRALPLPCPPATGLPPCSHTASHPLPSAASALSHLLQSRECSRPGREVVGHKISAQPDFRCSLLRKRFCSPAVTSGAPGELSAHNFA